MEIKQLLKVFKRWTWLMALGLLVGAASGFMASKFLTPTYEASTKVLVARTQQQKNSDTVYLNEQQLVETYVELLRTKSILDAASSEVGFKIDEERVRVQQVRTTQIIEVLVQDSNPERVAAIANALVKALLAQKDNLDLSRYEVAEDSIRTQLSQVEAQMSSLQKDLEQARTTNVQDQLSQVDAQIASLQDQIAKLQTEIANLTPAGTKAQRTELAQKQEQLSQLQPILYLYQQVRTNLLFIGQPSQSGSGSEAPQVLQLQSTLNLYQEIYLNLLNSLESIRLTKMQNTPTVSQVEEAVIPKSPVRPLPSLYTLLAGLIGLMLAAGAIFLIEYLDDTIKSADDVERILNVPVVGSIIETPRLNQPGSGIYLVSHPNTPTAEAFRLLRVGFNFAKSSKSMKTLALLSPTVGDGKSTIAVNLAALFAQGGKQVSLVDANVRQPQVHKMLGIENQAGFNEMLSGSADIQSVHYSLGEGEGFDVIPGGVLPGNPADSLEADNIERALAKIKKNSNIVIVDGPPLIFAEAQILASKVDAVLLVMRPGFTSTEQGQTMIAQLNRVGAHVVGVAMNRARSRKVSYHHYDPSRASKTNRLTSLMRTMWNHKSPVVDKEQELISAEK